MLRFALALGGAASIMGTTALLASFTADAVVHGAIVRLEASSGVKPATQPAALEVKSIECSQDSALSQRRVDNGLFSEEEIAACYSVSPSSATALPDILSRYVKPTSTSATKGSGQSPQAGHRRRSSVDERSVGFYDEDNLGTVWYPEGQLAAVASFLAAIETGNLTSLYDVCTADVRLVEKTLAGAGQKSSLSSIGTGVSFLAETLRNGLVPKRCHLDDAAFEGGRVLVHFDPFVDDSQPVAEQFAGHLFIFYFDAATRITQVVTCSA
mmetsp:Transcript_31517/g.74920  ORF Transcript_31517/g.74920 Transcript_31517/m.74920 type:complete len:269 (+) Transcript_31517:277-1083(+)